MATLNFNLLPNEFPYTKFKRNFEKFYGEMNIVY